MVIQRVIKLVVKFIVRFYLLILLAAVGLTAVSYPRAVGLFSNIDTDLTKLIPDTYKSVQSINEIRKKFRSIKTLILVVEDQNTQRAKEFISKLAVFIERDPLVSEVEYKKRGYDFFREHALLFLDYDDLTTIRDRINRKIQREKLGPLYVDFGDGGSDEEVRFGDLMNKYRDKYSSGSTSEYYTNDSQTIYALYVFPKSDPEGIKQSGEFYRRIQDDVRVFRSSNSYPNTKIYFTGTIRTHVDEYNTLIKDLKLAGIISGLGIFLVLTLYFRRPFAVGILFLPLVMAITVSFAYSSLFIKNLNLVTSFLFAILGGLGVEIGIHVLSRYIEERCEVSKRGLGGREAVEEALFSVIYHTGGSALTSAAAVAATFLVLILNNFKGFSEFGFIAGFGLIINYLFYVFVFPSVLIFAEKIRILKFRRNRRSGTVPADLYENGNGNGLSRFPMTKFILIGLGILAVISLFDIRKISFEWRFSKLKAEVPSALESKAKQRETSKTVNSPALVVVKNKKEADAIRDKLKSTQDANPSGTVIHTYKSYYDLVPDNQVEKMEVVNEIKKMLEDDTIKLVKGEYKKDLDRFKEALNETKLIKEEEVPQKVKELFLGHVEGDNSQVAYINPLPHLELDNGRNAIKFAEEVEKIETSIGTFYPSSNAIVFADVLRTMISNSKKVIVLAFLMAFIIVFLDFRSFSKTFLIISPIVLGVLYMTGFMYVLGLKLNFYNMVVAPTVVGTSIDNSVHLYHRYKEMGKGSLMKALRSTGSAALMSSLTNIFGFLGLAFAAHIGLRSIGILAVTGMISCLLTTLVFFPALLQFIEDREKAD